MRRLVLDTIAAVPFLVRSHPSHTATRRHAAQRTVLLTAHSLAETYSVLTRLPGDARVTGADAVRLLEANFGAAVAAPAGELTALPSVLAPLGIVGGAVYDALVGLAARAADIPLGHPRRTGPGHVRGPGGGDRDRQRVTERASFSRAAIRSRWGTTVNLGSFALAMPAS